MESSQLTEIIIATFMSVLCLIGIVTNIIAIVYYVRRPIMRTSTNVYLVHKAVSDLISLLLFPLHLVEMLSPNVGWSFGDWVCKFVAFLETLCMVASANITFAMAYDRYVAVANPGNGLERTVTKARNHVLVSWMYGFILVIPTITSGWTVVWPTNDPALGRRTCGYNWPSGESYHSMYFGSLFFLLYIGHYILYTSFFYMAWGQVKRSKDEFLSRHDTVQRCRAVLSVIALNFIGFSVYWAQHVYTMITLGEDQTEVPHIPSGLRDPLSIAASAAIYIVASANLFLYNLSMDQWRGVVRDAVRCRCVAGGGVQPFHAETVAVIDVTAAVDDVPREMNTVNINSNVNNDDNDSMMNLSNHLQLDEDPDIQEVAI